MSGGGGPVSDVRRLLAMAEAAYAGTTELERVQAISARLDEPLRVAIAGKVKAGKSTLLNALVGEQLAPTAAEETTRIVTWYVNGPTYRVTLHPHEGSPRQVPFAREIGAVDVDLGGTSADAVARLVVEWPTHSLRTMSLIDTPGIGSLSTDVSARTVAFLAPGEDQVTPADAVVYLLRHLHTTDVRMLEAFHDEEVSQATPVNAVGVLSRADEVAVGRLDAMASAARIAERYRRDPRIRRLCQTVVPVAGLLAETGCTLREAEFAALRELAAAPGEEVERLLVSVDRFVNAPAPVDLNPMEREVLLGRLGVFGLRLALALVRSGAAATASQLAAELVKRSGVDELRGVLSTRFAARRDALKARAALLALEALSRDAPVPATPHLRTEGERIAAGAHELAELRLLNALRQGGVDLSADEVEAMERLLGESGTTPAARLGLSPEAGPAEIKAALQTAIDRWQRRAENPLSGRPIVDAARVAIRTCEGMLVAQLPAS